MSIWFSLTSIETKKKIDSSSISSYWYRRGNLKLLKPNINQPTSLNKYILEYLNKDLETLKHFILKYFESLPSIGSYYYEISTSNNKLYNLALASCFGLNIPDKTIISNRSQDVIKYLSNEHFISKAISEFGYWHKKDNVEIIAGTYRLRKELVKDITEIGYSLLQTELKKKYDIRAVYFFGKVFSALLCSQDCTESQTDFRFKNGGYRICNFEFNEQIKIKICKLMTKLKYNFVSIDFVWTMDNELIFLEINPNGQVGAYNTFSGWDLYNEIANKLIENEKNN